MPSIQGIAVKYMVRIFSLLTLGSYGPLKYQRFLFNSVVPRLGMKIEGIRSEPADVSGINAEWLIPDAASDDRALLYLHGGAYVLGSIDSHRGIASHIAIAAGCRVLLVDYRLAPENKFPAALDDAVAAYRWLLAQGYMPERIAIAGDSAGGGLTAATLVSLRDSGNPLPAAGIMLSPWADLQLTGESCKSVGRRDPMISVKGLRKGALGYAGRQSLREPLISPIYADLKGLPPLYIQVGTCEILLDDSRRLAEKAMSDGVDVELYVCDGMFHVYQVFSPLVPESRDAIDKLGAFYKKKVTA